MKSGTNEWKRHRSTADSTQEMAVNVTEEENKDKTITDDNAAFMMMPQTARANVASDLDVQE